MRKTMIAIAFLGACSVTAANASSDASVAMDDPQGAASVPRLVNPVVRWNRTLLAIVRTPNAQPASIHPTRSFAIMHAAIYDAVNAIDRSHTPYLVRLDHVSRLASQEAAAAAAAHDVLVALYPALGASLDAELLDSLAQISHGADQAEGILVGQTVAARMLALRQDDGSSASPIPYVFGSNAGDYQSPPPNVPRQPQFTHWSHVRPFALPRADRFRPPAPPALASGRYANALNEVKALGVANGTSSSSDQALAGRFWNGPIQNYWNEIAQAASEKSLLTTVQDARLFALLNFAIADSVIAFYDAKYMYNLWRPVTAIRAAADDGNPETLADPSWLPVVGNTPPDPSYPGAHAVVSAAALDVLLSVLKRDRVSLTVTSEVLPGVARSFESFSAAADEASLSRVFAGVHFRFDLTRGSRLGHNVADFVTDRLLVRCDADDERQDDGDDAADRCGRRQK